MKGSTALGIDVVDLEDAHRRGGPSPRFVDRVYSESERDLFARHPDRPDLPWIVWAAKEAAFKAVTLARGRPPVFTHADFVVQLAELPDTGPRAGGEVRGRVRWREHALTLGGSLSSERVVAWAVVDHALPTVWRWARLAHLHRGYGELPLADVTRRHLSEREAEPVHSIASALARLAVRREAAGWLGDDEATLEVICRPGRRGQVPPHLHRRGEPLPGVGITISHHGAWIAWGVGGGAPVSEGGDGS